MNLKEIFPARYIKSVNDEEYILKVLKELEKEGKIKRIEATKSLSGYPLDNDVFYKDKDETDAPFERWYQDVETGEIWAFISPDFPRKGEWVKVDDKLKELEEYKNNFKKIVELRLMIKFYSVTYFYNFINNLHKELNITGNKIKLEFGSFLNDIKERTLKLDINEKEKFIENIIKNSINYESFDVDFTSKIFLSVNIFYEVNYDNNVIFEILFFVDLNEEKNFVIRPFSISLEKFKDLLKESRAQILKENYNFDENKFIPDLKEDEIIEDYWSIMDNSEIQKKEAEILFKYLGEFNDYL